MLRSDELSSNGLLSCGVFDSGVHDNWNTVGHTWSWLRLCCFVQLLPLQPSVITLLASLVNPLTSFIQLATSSRKSLYKFAFDSEKIC